MAVGLERSRRLLERCQRQYPQHLVAEWMATVKASSMVWLVVWIMGEWGSSSRSGI